MFTGFFIVPVPLPHDVFKKGGGNGPCLELGSGRLAGSCSMDIEILLRMIKKQKLSGVLNS